ncbi:hypothetical protein E4T89_09120 [Jeotgalicoccus nanhaiensis]|uniref:SbsA Ig-like domain-containing protein n=1 Tax=Jeotgalicoccus nanhaiensis TaxID=568603 RepID=A0ABR9XZT6_9STAP|nr:hypothetical protein [Jeotgalicoccus nanhaiensis]MBF0754437.1 hypothetical protein [Jeotgalicoccus nanhaiensis]TFU61143.1 hypothetical protein E4T89_09120 [Jeotgalicoccus nanhaiensis]
MNKILLTVLSVVLLAVAGCGGEESELDDKTLGLTSPNPTVSEEDAENKEVKFTSNTPVLDFESAGDVTLTFNGATYPGEYSLEENNLSITVEDGDASMIIDFTEFEESDDEYFLYSGTVSDGELNEGDETSQLTNVYKNFGLGEHYLFLEE